MASQVLLSPAVTVMLSEKDRRKKRPIIRKSSILITDILQIILKPEMCATIYLVIVPGVFAGNG